MDGETAESHQNHSNGPLSATSKSKVDTGNLVVVGIGASAGGLEAFSILLKNLPNTTGMAFVLIQHLDPHHASALSELLSSKTAMPVVEVEKETPLEADRVYVIPPNRLMLVRKRVLSLEARPPANEKFRPIDTLFASLAEEFHSAAAGVVLSGTASDGTLGLKAIKAEGGITFAQDETAKFDGMPRSAIAAGVVDFVLPPQRIAQELTTLANRSRYFRGTEAEPAALDVPALQRTLTLLRKQRGVDFAQYKPATILRRLNRRMLVRNSETIEQYFDLLKTEPQEVNSLFDDLLINVTDFFRDPEVFETAKRTAFRSIVRDRPSGQMIRVWTPGCSTGEEVYSLAIALTEFLEAQGLDCGIRMFGTDVSQAAIAKARVGNYSESSLISVSPERLRRFFQRTEGGYQINRSIREMCVFSQQNVAHDPPLSHMDLITCRNLLIYFSPALQRRVMATFLYALRPSGCLILGPSETLGTLSEYFQTLDEPHKIYCSKANVRGGILPMFGLGEDQSSDLSFPAMNTPRTEIYSPGGPIHKYVDRLLLEQFGPTGVVLDESLQIAEYRGDMTPYFIAPVFEPEADLMKVVRPELRASLSSAIEQAQRTNVGVVTGAILSHAGSPTPIVITAVPISLAGNTRHFLILFGRPGELENLALVKGSDGSVSVETAEPAPAEQSYEHLQLELKNTREYLQSVIEELRSVNEEAQSANEELQSTNEELKTSQEELQSSNEELHTVNGEMQGRNLELAQLNDDLLNLLASMNTPIVMTGRDLRIRRFTPTAERVLRLIATDVGRPISDLKPRINVPNLEEILQQVLDTLRPHEQEVHDEEGRLYLMRVRPYRSAENRIDGTVLQLIDVTELRQSLDEVRYARDYAQAIVDTVRDPLVVLDENLAITDANRAFYDVLKTTQGATLGHKLFEVAHGRFDLPAVHTLFEQLNHASAASHEIEIEHRPERGEVRNLLVSARRLRAQEQKQLILVAFEDITDRKRAADARYRRLFESARDGIVLIDARTAEIMDVNPYVERLFGYSRNSLVGRTFWETEPMQNVPTMRSALQQIRDQGVSRFDDLVLRNSEGAELHTEVIANVYWEGDRQAIQFNIRDVSERKKFEHELQETQKLESLGLLAGGIAHDFNNLLTGILGNASFAYTELPPEEPMRARLREIIQASERAGFLTRQMLAYAGRGRFVTETFDVGDLVRETSTLVRTSIPKTVDLVLNTAPDLPPIEADPAQIQQIIMNLLINAGEAIGENKQGRLEIRTSIREFDAREAAELFRPEHSQPGVYIQLEVKDNGPGMDEATKARIFEPFFTTKFTGRGLGLAAVQGIVKAHGGAIRVYSTPGHGTTFLVFLPAKSASAVEVRAAKIRPSTIPPHSVVLVIEDEPVVRSVVTRVLSRAGVKVLTAENGKQGVDLFLEHQPIISLVLLDLQMPVMGGEEALAHLKEIDPDVTVILSSGFDESEAHRRFSNLDLAAFLQKPYTNDRLIEAIAGALQRKHSSETDI